MLGVRFALSGFGLMLFTERPALMCLGTMKNSGIVCDGVMQDNLYKWLPV